MLAILIGSQSVGLLISMHADESPLWTRTWREYSPDDWTNVAKWSALALLVWEWCAAPFLLDTAFVGSRASMLAYSC